MESSSNIHTIVKAQIVFLLSTLTEDNFERNQSEIRSLSEQHGIDVYFHFIRRLIVHSHNRIVSNANPTSFDSSSNLTFQLLVQETQRLARDPFLSVRFKEAVDKGEGEAFRSFDLRKFSERIGLHSLERLILCAPILVSATKKELVTQAHGIIQQDFEDSTLSLLQQPAFENGTDLSPTQVVRLLTTLLSDPPCDSPVLTLPQIQTLLIATGSKYGSEKLSPALRQILSNLSLPKGTTLPEALIELGPEVTTDPEVILSIFRRFGFSETSPPSEAVVLDLFCVLSSAASEGEQLCDIASLIKALTALPTAFTWPQLITVLDRPDRNGADTSTLKLVVSILLACPPDAKPHAVEAFWSRWSNSLHQIKLLEALVSLPSDTFNFVRVPGRRVVTVDDVAGASPTIKALAANVQGQTWNSLPLFEVLMSLADMGILDVQSVVRDMLEKAVRISSELVHMGLLQVSKPWNEIQQEFASQMLAMFLAGHPNHQLVFMRIWQIDQGYLTQAFIDFYQENQLNITRISDIAQDLKILETLLGVRPFVFALDVAALASRREYLNLDKWLADKISDHGTEFLRAVMDFLDGKTSSEKEARMLEPAVEPRTMALNPQTIAIFLRVLRNNSASLSPNDVDYCLEIRNACLQIYPRLMSLIPGSDQEPGFSVTSYSPEVENEVDGIYRQLYEEHISVDQVIATLQRFKVSSNPSEHEIFACMLHFLFDEFRFFSAYPERQLGITAYLFGSLIQYNLVDYIPLGIAIRYVLDSLQCPPESILFKFGLLALARFETRLSEWQPLCQALLQIPHLQEAHPELITNIRRMLAEVDHSAPPQPPIPPAQLPFTFVHVDPLPTGHFTQPNEDASDKILFIINNLAPSNFEQKVEEMKERLEDSLSAWFAKYLVGQRILTEPNNHSLYQRFLDSLDRKILWKLVEHETLAKAAEMLNDESVQQSTQERATLKNLGTWFGLITLAKNKPIKYKNIAFKELLLEAYDTNRLIVALPFVCKTLEGGSLSKVFKPPNPWIMSLLGLLAELYKFADMKLNLKFEIEVLCKSFKLDLQKVEPTNVLRNRPLQDAMGDPLLPDYLSDIGNLPVGGYDPNSMIHPDQQLMGLAGASDGDGHRVVGTHIETILAALVNSVTINAQLAPFNTDSSFRRAVQSAVDRTVREIIVPVVERSVTIAGISTRELVSKDFSMEANEEKMRKAAHLMAQKLAGSLALVTCKEPLRNNLGPHIRQHLTDRGFGEQLLSDQVITILASDNLDAACRAVETAAMERAVVEVDEAFLSQYEMRRRHRETRGGLPFWDSTSTSAHADYSSHLPDPLKIKPAGLAYPQFRVYEDFIGFDPKRKAPARPFSRTDQLNAFTTRIPVPEVPVRTHGPVLITPHEVMERFSGIMNDLEGLLSQFPAVSLSSLPANSDIRAVVRQPLHLVMQCTEREKPALQMSQRIVQYLYKTQVPLGREVYVAMLDHLCQAFREVQKEATEWLIYAEDERKYNVPVTVALLKSGLINLPQQDQQLARLIWKDPRPTLTDFAANLIRECTLSDPPVAQQAQFPESIITLVRASEVGKLTVNANQVLEDLGILRRSNTQQIQSTAEGATGTDAENLNDRLFKWFHQWVNLIQQSNSPEKTFIPFVSRLQKEGILKQEDISFLFFRVCTESSVETYMNNQGRGIEVSFRAIDALSKLISLIVRYHGDVSANNNDQLKAHYLTKILSIVVVVLAHEHEEQGLAFQQKPFFRFFSSLLNDLSCIQVHVGSAYFPLILALSDTFSSLQPMYFPGFAFSWMSLISHRLYLPKLLMSENRGGWAAFHTLILSMFKFLAFFLKTPNLKHAGSDLYRGASRILLLLLHDFPEFLSEHYFSICDVIPYNCVQLRNVVLSAFPVNITLPDPYVPYAQLEAIPQMSTIPPVLSNFSSALQTGNLRAEIDQILSSRSLSSVSITSVQDKLRNRGGEEYNLSLINGLVMYVGVSSVAQAKARSGSPLFNPADPGVLFFQLLGSSLDPEGQHHILTSMAIHLRYPNAHTHWFSSLILHLFSTSKVEKFREIVTKVLLERFIGHRPHPWGVLVTVIELLRGPKYDFWNREFIRSVPEISLLLESVARSMFPPV